ncbi:MAG TPA: hypothetical protein PK299_02985 [Anaerolineales bacterium]|nr:hypothetical protein [Anaerolineales bacterium]
MTSPTSHTTAWAERYARFTAPITQFDCGQFCAPLSHNGEPFCCSTHNIIPVADVEEWDFLQKHTDLWRLYVAPNAVSQAVADSAGEGLVALQCKGHWHCQRDFRTLACRAFPFFPYITRQREFIGLSYYWEYEDVCWVLSHLQRVEADFRSQFVATFDELFQHQPSEKSDYLYQSQQMRRAFGRKKLHIPLLHRNGSNYWVTPASGVLTPASHFPPPPHSCYLP